MFCLNFFYISNYYLNIEKNTWWCVILLLAGNSIVSGAQNVGNVFKRQEFDDYRSCARNFEIHQDKIIRTEESKKMGAKYLNGKEVTSKDECIKFCCRTPNCNVFVLEEKVFNQEQGTCYLFECGSSDNFKCKFTRHHNYSSAVFIASRPQLLLEDEIQFTQHERELTSLRHGVNGTKSKNCVSSAKTPSSVDQSNLNEVAQESSKNVEDEVPFKKSGRCSRFQFECRSSGECIAIYNACDGIPQCADHSDEDAELGCPTNVPVPVLPKKSVDEGESIGDHTTNDNTLAHNTGIEDSIHAPYIKNNMENPSPGHGVQSVDQNYINRRINSGVKINPWQSKLNQPSHRPTHNYNHKQNGMNIPYNFGEYGNVELNSMYDGYNVNNNYNYNNDNNENRNLNGEMKTNVYQQSNGNPWRGKLSLISDLDSKNSELFGNRAAPEFYYEDNTVQLPNKMNGPNMVPENARRNEQHRNVPVKDHPNGTAKLANSNLPHQSTEIITATAANSSTTAPVIISAPSSSISTSTKVNAAHNASQKSIIQPDKQSPSAEAAQQVTTIKEDEKLNKDSNESQANDMNFKKNSHLKLEKELSAELLPAQEKYFNVKSADYRYTQHPSGAFVSLSLGVCVTAVMIFVVAYRLKIVRKRIRRGKLPYAHDADFLVNGMYL